MERKFTVWMACLCLLGLVGKSAMAVDETDAVSGASPHVLAFGADLSKYQQGGPAAELFARWNASLGLSVEQQAVIGEIVADYAARLRPLIETGLQTGWSILNVAPLDPEYSLDTEAAAQTAAQTAADMVRLISEMRSAVHSVMTAEQIATLDRLIREERDRVRQKMLDRAEQNTAPASSE